MIGLVKEFVEFCHETWVNLPVIFSFLVQYYNYVVCILIILSILVVEYASFRKVYKKEEFSMDELRKIKKMGVRLSVFKIIALITASFFAIGPVEVIFETQAGITFITCLPPIILIPHVQKTILPYLYFEKAHRRNVGQYDLGTFLLCEALETFFTGHNWKELEEIVKFDTYGAYKADQDAKAEELRRENFRRMGGDSI